MKANGIGPLVSQAVHAWNLMRRVAHYPEKAGATAPDARPRRDVVELGEQALARFAAWQAKQASTRPGLAPSPAAPPVTEPVSAPVARTAQPLPVAAPPPGEV